MEKMHYFPPFSAAVLRSSFEKSVKRNLDKIDRRLIAR
jgi:hypothetical protein